MHICFPHNAGSGGPGSFQTRLEHGLRLRGHQVSHYGSCTSVPDVVLVVGGTRKILWLKKMKRRGAKIIHRLDGRLWLHKTKPLPMSIHQAARSELQNTLVNKIRTHIADHVIYQSNFVKSWWNDQNEKSATKSSVIYNAVDLNAFSPPTPDVNNTTAGERTDIACVEGNIDYSPYAIDLVNYVAKTIATTDAKLHLYGGLADATNRQRLAPEVIYYGPVDREKVAKVYRGRIYLSLDVNPACPNAVIEALASGAPVIAYDTGAISEIVGEAGEVVSYGSDPWTGQPPSFQHIINAYSTARDNFASKSKLARNRAETHFGIDSMIDQYVDIFAYQLQHLRN